MDEALVFRSKKIDLCFKPCSIALARARKKRIPLGHPTTLQTLTDLKLQAVAAAPTIVLSLVTSSGSNYCAVPGH